MPVILVTAEQLNIFENYIDESYPEGIDPQSFDALAREAMLNILSSRPFPETLDQFIDSLLIYRAAFFTDITAYPFENDAARTAAIENFDAFMNKTASVITGRQVHLRLPPLDPPKGQSAGKPTGFGDGP